MSEWIALKEACDLIGSSSVVFVDCRFDLADKEAGRRAYEDSHIPGAHYLDLEKDLSSPVQTHGGRHPLPDVDKLVRTLGAIGIDETQHVIAYDDQNGSMAARLWWLLKYYGHEKVQVLEAGFRTWQTMGYPMTAEKPPLSPRVFTAHLKKEWVVDSEGVKALPKEEVLIDSRAPERYRGDVEPLDKKAGHIPRAINVFWQDSVKDGKWRSSEDLQARFHDLLNESLTVYCGSGVTACANFLALTEAGHKKLRLYPGSWSDWISYEEHPVEIGDTKATE